MERANDKLIVAPVKKSAVMIRRELIGNADVMGALTPVERAVFLASTAKTIAEITPEQLAVELRTALKWICKDVGYRIQDEADSQYLVIRTTEILKRYYSNLTLKDFRMAFEMSLTGELDDFLPRGRDGQADRNHYQQFNADYVCKILNAYKGRRGAILKKAYDAKLEAEQPRDPEMEKEYREATKRDCIEAFEYYRIYGYLPDMSPIGEMLCYNLLSSVGLAPEVNVTIEEQKAILQHAINKYARNGMVGDMRRLQQAGPDAPELQHGAFVYARRKALAATFRRMVEQEINITDYIKFE